MAPLQLAGMDTDLRALLEANGVHSDIIGWLENPTQSCMSIKNFANWVDNKEDLQAAVLDHVNAQKEKRIQLSCLKQARGIPIKEMTNSRFAVHFNTYLHAGCVPKANIGAKTEPPNVCLNCVTAP